LVNKPITAILSDVDGTLYVSGPLQRAILTRLLYGWRAPASGWRTIRVIVAYRAALEALRTRLTTADIASEQMLLAAERAGVSLDEVYEIVGEWFGREPLRVLSSCAHEGLVDFLVRASAGSIRMGVASDYDADWKLDALGIAQYFDVVVTPAITGRLKPHPEVRQTAVDLLRSDPEQTLYVGDRVDVDVQAAQNAGIRCAILGKRFLRKDSFVPFNSYRHLAELLWP
jgi:HAD superfamily hydrolase (TIGR01549 family)